MRLSDKVRLVGEVLGSLRRSAPDLSTARARYDPMLQSLADRLAAEFGVTWTDEQEAELDQSGRRWHYTTKVLRCDQALNVFPDWSSRYARVVESVATVGVLGTSGDDGTRDARRTRSHSSEGAPAREARRHRDRIRSAESGGLGPLPDHP